MKRLAILLGVALVGFALIPNLAQAQVIVVQSGRTYAPPVIFNPPVVSSYYVAPGVTTYSPGATTTYSYYPRTNIVTYSAPPVVTYASPSVVTYSPQPVVTYSAPAAIITRPGIVETRSYYGLGILRPRGWNTETRYYP